MLVFLLVVCLFFACFLLVLVVCCLLLASISDEAVGKVVVQIYDLMEVEEEGVFCLFFALFCSFFFLIFLVPVVVLVMKQWG